MRLRFLAILALVLAVLGLVPWWLMIRMPGHSHSGALESLDESGLALAVMLRQDVETLAGLIGERNVWKPLALQAAAAHIESVFEAAHLETRRELYEASGVQVANVIAELPGTSSASEIVIVGAHYDSVEGCPGANDNGSGVAVLLALARRLATQPGARTLRLVAFANEEPPFFQEESMGSLVHARGCRDRDEQIVCMISLETMGCFSDEPGSQAYPTRLLKLCYPSRGNFIAFVGNLSSAQHLRRAISQFRGAAHFPSEGALLPEWIPGVGWSDHWAFWQVGYPAFMVTDTAPFRYPQYHTSQDTPARVDCESIARIVPGLEQVVRDLLGR